MVDAQPADAASALEGALYPGGTFSDNFNLAVLRELKKSFDVADEDGSGGIDEEEFVEAVLQVAALRDSMVGNDVNHLFMKIDANSDGTIDWDEFTNHIMLEQTARNEDDANGPAGRPYVKVTSFEQQGKPGAKDGEKSNKPALDKLFDDPRMRRRVQAFVASLAESQSKEPGAARGVRGGDAFGAADTSTGPKAGALGGAGGYGSGGGSAKRSLGGGRELQSREEHADMIQKILWLPSLGAYVSAGRDGVLRQWDGASVRSQRWMNNGAAWITDIACTASQPLAVCAADRTISFYDAGRPSMDPLGRITQLDNVPMCAAWMHVSENDMFLYGDDRGSVYTYALADEWGSEGAGPGGVEVGKKVLSGMKLEAPHRAHSDWVTKIMYLSHSETLLTSSMDGTLLQTDFESRKVKWKVTDHQYGVHSFAVCRSFNFIASCGLERNVLLFNPFAGKRVGLLAGHSAPVCDVIVNEADSQLISLSTDKVIKIWDIRSNKCMQTITDKTEYRPENRISAIAFNPQRKAIVTGATRLDLYERKRRQEAVSHPVAAALYNRAFSQVVAGDAGGVVSVYDCIKGGRVFSFSEAHGTSKISAMAFDNSGRRLLTGAQDGTLYMWNFNNGSRLNEYKGFGPAEITCCAYIEDGHNRYVAAAGWNRAVCVWHDTGAAVELLQHRMDAYTDDIICMAFCAPNVIATGSHDGKVLLWKVDGLLKQTLAPPGLAAMDADDRPVTALVQLREVAGGDVLAAAGADGAVRFYSIASGALLHELVTQHPKERGGISALCVVPDNGTLYTADGAGTVACWSADVAALASLAYRSVPAPSPGTSPRHRAKLADKVAASASAPSALLAHRFSWRAHDTKHSVVSMDVVESGFLLTASDDGSVRLWSREGALAGVFGQDERWELGQTSTWKQPLPRHLAPADAAGSLAEGDAAPTAALARGAEAPAGAGADGSADASTDGAAGAGAAGGAEADGTSSAAAETVKAKRKTSWAVAAFGNAKQKEEEEEEEEEEAVDEKLLLRQRIAELLTYRSRSHAQAAFAATLEKRLPLQPMGEVDAMLETARARLTKVGRGERGLQHR